MSDERALQTFKDYVGIKLHFTDEKFLWTPSFSGKITYESLSKKRELKLIHVLANKFRKREEQINWFVTAFIEHPTAWVGDLLNQEYHDKAAGRIKRVNSLKLNFMGEIENITDFMLKNGMNVRGLLLTNKNKPAIISRRREIVGGVSDETLALLDYGFKYLQRETNDPLWKQKSFLLSKYKYFIDFDKAILRDGVKAIAEIEGIDPHEKNTQQQKGNTLCQLLNN